MQSLIEKLSVARAAYEAAYKLFETRFADTLYTNDERAERRAAEARLNQTYKHYCAIMHTCQQELNKMAFEESVAALIHSNPKTFIRIDIPSTSTPLETDVEEAVGFV